MSSMQQKNPHAFKKGRFYIHSAHSRVQRPVPSLISILLGEWARRQQRCQLNSHAAIATLLASAKNSRVGTSPRANVKKINPEVRYAVAAAATTARFAQTWLCTLIDGHAAANGHRNTRPEPSALRWCELAGVGFDLLDTQEPGRRSRPTFNSLSRLWCLWWCVWCLCSARGVNI